MARIRTIKPAFFSSISNADLPIPTRMTWIGLWTYVDDKGRAVDDARLVKAAVWPLDDAYTAKKVEADLVRLEKAGKIGRYIVDGQRYLAVVNWRRHQRIDKPQPSTIPAAPWEEPAKNDPRPTQEDSGNVPGTTPPKDGGEVEGNKEGKGSGREGKGSALSPAPNHQVAGPPTGVEKDQNQDIGLEPGKPCQGCDECSAPDPLAERLATLWPNRLRMVAESKAVVATCRTVAADDVIDEAIGTMLALDSPPRTPRYLLSTVLNRLVAGGAYGEGDPRLDVLRTKTPAVRG